MNIIIMGLCSCLGVFLENPLRTQDYILYTFTKNLDGIWNFSKKFGPFYDIPHSMKFIFALSTGILLVMKLHHKNETPESHNRLLSLVFGKEKDELIKTVY